MSRTTTGPSFNIILQSRWELRKLHAQRVKEEPFESKLGCKKQFLQLGYQRKSCKNTTSFMLSHYNSTWLHKKSFTKAHFISPLKRLVHFQGIISLSKQVCFNFQSLLKRCSSHSPIPSVNWKKTKDLRLNNFLVLHINKDANSSLDFTVLAISLLINLLHQNLHFCLLLDSVLYFCF